MKSKVCSMANALVNKGYTQSEAFTKAWALAKAEAVSYKMHCLSLSSDYYNAEQLEESYRLQAEHARHCSRANSIQTATEKAAVEAARQKAIDDWNRAEDIRFELGCMVRKGITDGEKYNALRAELKTLAA